MTLRHVGRSLFVGGLVAFLGTAGHLTGVAAQSTSSGPQEASTPRRVTGALLGATVGVMGGGVAGLLIAQKPGEWGALAGSTVLTPLGARRMGGGSAPVWQELVATSAVSVVALLASDDAKVRVLLAPLAHVVVTAILGTPK